MINSIDLTLLKEEEIWGSKQLEVLKKYGVKAAITDLAILTGAFVADTEYNIEEDKTLKGRVGWQWTSSDDKDGNVRAVDQYGNNYNLYRYCRNDVVRPALQSSIIFSQISPNIVRGYNGVEEVEYGEYPQMAPDKKVQDALEKALQSGKLKATGKKYTFDSTKYDEHDTGFKPVSYDEYEYEGKKYIRVKANSDFGENKFQLSNEEYYKDGDFVWIEVQPVRWLVDRKSKKLIAKKGLVSGIRYLAKDKKYTGDFKSAEMKAYMDKYMVKDLFTSVQLVDITKLTPEEQIKLDEERKQDEKKRNPYNFSFDSVSEEEIIRGAIASGVAVFLHGPSSEGKSARIKQIDPTCEIIYLLNSTLDSLNGKSVFNQATGQMIDVPPTWFKKLQEKCEKEPDKIHIVFFDEITNALPSIQGSAFNIILDREVNGIWELPENARVVAAGNEMKDSLAANPLVEPLFNRFAHVYIHTTTEDWLKWASENNIHPAIYTYIAYTQGEALRSEYNGETPNADPRKWEMASKVLYATGKPEMLRALVGEDITKEFIEFCSQRVITLEDVINGNYKEEEIQSLNTAERYATTMGLSRVKEDNLSKVRLFVNNLGAEFTAIFDALWTHGDESRLERILEEKLTEEKGGIKR